MTKIKAIYRRKIIIIIAFFTRKFHPRGIGRILRLLYHPDRRQFDSIETIVPYDDNLKIHINTNSFIEWEIFFKGYYDPEMVSLIKKYLPCGGTFVDVGANIGAFTLIASKIAKKVIAIEPVPECCARLQENIKLNNFNNIIIMTCAASNKTGVMPLYCPSDCNKGQASLHLECLPDKNIINKIMVNTYLLDDLLENETSVDFIKIDAQGHDKKIIEGAKKIIDKFHPFIIYENEKNMNVIL